MGVKDGKLRKEVARAQWLTDNLHKLVRDLSSDEYHNLRGTFSSSQFKDMLGDEEVFIKKYIKREVEKVETAAFDVGNYFHVGVLEPHKLKQDCVVFTGKIRRGGEWEAFREKHKGKAIVTQDQKTTAEGLVRAVKNSPVAQQYLDGEPEVSLFVELVVYNGRIFSPKYKKVLTRTGWEPCSSKEIGEGYTLYVKVRADNLGETYISDLKSTSGNARDEDAMRTTVSRYKYDLSAALYLDMFSLIRPSVREFWWIFASKELLNSKSYRASNNQIMIGRAKYMKAMVKMADCAANNWEVADYPGELEPMPYELDWLREKDSDLL